MSKFSRYLLNKFLWFMVAFAVISALGQNGIRVPEDVSVMGFDGLALGARFYPPLTTVRQPIADMGNIAIELA